MEDQALEEIKKLLLQVNGYDFIQFLSQDPQLLRHLENTIIYHVNQLKEDSSPIQLYPELTSQAGFQALVEMVEKTQNVNRSNIAAVLSVASRKSPDLQKVVDTIELVFSGDMGLISGFFREYFEQTKGWKFNKYNRKDGIKPEFKQTSGIWSELVKYLLQRQPTSEPAFVRLANMDLMKKDE
jgi:hypothetical protein